MTITELYRHFLHQLNTIYPPTESAAIASLVFENLAAITPALLIKNPEQSLDENTLCKFNLALSALKTYKPVQYVLGEAWFYKMKLNVSPAVLIPRPETEELVEAVIHYLKDKPGTHLLDIGTGSGCIPVAIKKNLPLIHITAIDISREALNVAKENTLQQQTNMDLFEIDFLDESTWHALPVFDVIVSNPPYIPSAEKQLLDKNVTAFEPPIALFVENERPLIFYEKIASFGMKHLKDNGKIYVETHEAFAEQTASLFSNDAYSSTIEKDISGKQRMVIAIRHYR